MLVSLTACGTQPASSDSMAAYAGQSVTGQITVLDGTSVTLQIGELSQSDDMQPSDATPPEKPESDASGDTAAEDAGTQPSDATLPEKPEGDATGETTEQTTGAQPSDMTLPDKPEGDDSAAMDGSALPDGQTPPDALPGGQTFTAGTQTLTGDISVDVISSLQMRLCSGSTYTGAIQMVENAQRGTSADAQVNVTIESGCTWVLTGDRAITSLDNNGTIDFNGYTITLADGTVLQRGFWRRSASQRPSWCRGSGWPGTQRPPRWSQPLQKRWKTPPVLSLRTMPLPLLLRQGPAIPWRGRR